MATPVTVTCATPSAGASSCSALCRGACCPVSRCSAKRGRCDAMEDICCWDITDGEPFEALVELVDLHLVEPVHAAGAEAGFGCSKPFAASPPRPSPTSGDAGGLLDRHADHYMAFALRAGAALQGKDDHRWAARVDRELPNVRAALQHLATSGRSDEGLAATAALGPYWLDRGPMHEGRDWLDRFLPSANGAPRVRAIAVGWSARLALEQGDIGDVTPSSRRAAEVGTRCSRSRRGSHRMASHHRPSEQLAASPGTVRRRGWTARRGPRALSNARDRLAAGRTDAHPGRQRPRQRGVRP